MAFIKEFLTLGVHQECKDASLDTFWLQRNTQTKINLDFYLINKHICIYAYLYIVHIYIFIFMCVKAEKKYNNAIFNKAYVKNILDTLYHIFC